MKKKIPIRAYCSKLKDIDFEWGNVQFYQTRTEAEIDRRDRYKNIKNDVEIIEVIITQK